jgi:Rrf2 family protein
MSAEAPWRTEHAVPDVRLALHDDSSAAAVSPRADAALRVLLALAGTPAPGVLTAEALARAQRLTRRMLDPVLLDLSRSGMVVGLRGQSGGYRLAWASADVTLADVIAAVDRPLAEACGLGGRSSRVRPPADGLAAMWLGVRAGLRDVLESFTLEALVQEQPQR